MSLTLITNYKEVLSTEVLEIVEELVENDYPLEDVLSILDYFGDDYSIHLAHIVETLEDTDADNSELYDFLEEFSVEDLEYFAKYKDLKDDYDPAAVDAFISLNNISDVEHFTDAYEGQFDRVRDFVVYYMETYDVEIPSWISIDYEDTFDNLSEDFVEEDDYYFKRNF
jgi:hypothetical protein